MPVHTPRNVRREGYWVEGRYYGLARHQAIARAHYLAEEHAKLAYVYRYSLQPDDHWLETPIYVAKPRTYETR